MRETKVDSSDDDFLKDFGSEFQDLAQGLDKQDLEMKDIKRLISNLIEQVSHDCLFVFLFICVFFFYVSLFLC